MPDPVWLGLGLALLLTTALALLAPLRRGPARGDGRRESALGIFEDQLAELDRDAARGLISADEARSARIEIERRMLGTSRMASGPATMEGRGARRLLVAVALLVPIAGAGLYWTISDPLARTGVIALEMAERADIAALARQLRGRLESDPDSPTEGWLLLARTEVGLGNLPAAIAAYEYAAKRDDITPDGLARYAELLIGSTDGAAPTKAVEALDRALTMAADAARPAFRAAYLRAALHERAGKTDEAVALLDETISRSPSGNAPASIVALRDDLRSRSGRPSAPGPSAADIAAAEEMSPDEQAAFIRSMVDGLAERLKTSPDDLDGWLRLAHAYTVLDEADSARAAYLSAEPLLSDVAPRRSTPRPRGGCARSAEIVLDQPVPAGASWRSRATSRRSRCRASISPRALLR